MIPITAIRVASQIGNATGAGDFNAGATGAQTLRVESNQGAANATPWNENLAQIAGVAPSATNPMPSQLSDGAAYYVGAKETTQVANGVLIGGVTEAAPATDTASSGLNGRLQRIAQRLTSMIALLPAALGRQADASSFSVALSTEDAALVGSLTESAPGTDTASSGLNGRLQRIAQNITAENVLVGAVTETAPGTDTASSGLNGRLQRIAQRLTSLIAFFAADYGVSSGAIRVASQIGNASGVANFGAGATGAQTVRVEANQGAASTTPWLISTGGRLAVAKARNDYTSTSVTTGAYVQLIASVGSTAVTEIEIFDSSGQTLVLATGAGGAEVDQFYILPGGNGRMSFSIAASTRVAVKAVSATASVGELTVNFYG